MSRSNKGQHLSRWNDGMREMYLDLRAKNWSVAKAQELVLESYNSEVEVPWHTYKYGALLHFEREGGHERLSELESDFRSGAIKRSFSHKGSRVGSLVEVATKILTRFLVLDEDADAAVPSLTALSREFRETLVAIQREVDPLGLSDITVLSAHQELLQMVNTLSADGKKMLRLDAFVDSAPEEGPS